MCSHAPLLRRPISHQHLLSTDQLFQMQVSATALPVCHPDSHGYRGSIPRSTFNTNLFAPTSVPTKEHSLKTQPRSVLFASDAWQAWDKRKHGIQREVVLPQKFASIAWFRSCCWESAAPLAERRGETKRSLQLSRLS